jgi:hypothetical protein
MQISKAGGVFADASCDEKVNSRVHGVIFQQAPKKLNENGLAVVAITE